MVYFIGNREKEVVKIGYTSGTAEKRLKELQTGCPFKLEVLHTIEDATIKDEKRLHAKYSEYRLNGEWFTLNWEIEKLTYENSYYNLYLSNGESVGIYKDEDSEKDLFFTEFEYIGELKLYNMILIDIVVNGRINEYTYTDEDAVIIQERLGLQKSTQRKYLKQTVKKGFLIKLGKNKYALNTKYVKL
jgi:hypothetical protein